jgi:hypothetical protein
LGGDALENVGEELGDVLAAVAQGWNRDPKGSKAVCQLRGKAIGTDKRSQATL